MREIKFRAWDKEKQTWLHDFRIHPFGNIMPATGLLDEAPGGMWLYEKGLGPRLENIELMQFTGLKDKNGKEIYEGDILQNGEGPRTRREEVCWAKYSESDVDYGGYFYGYHFYKLNPADSEIIGNIYENPELLTPS